MTGRGGFVLGAMLVLIALRSLQLACMSGQLYLGEFAQFGALLWDIEHGQFTWEGVLALARRYRWFRFAQGTVFVQIGAALLGRWLPPLWALHGVTIGAEALAVGALAALSDRVLPGRRALAAASVAAVILVPGPVVAWQLMPFGNHTEFLWVAAGVALLLAGERFGPAQALGVTLLLAFGLGAYRAHVLTTAALLLATLGRPRRQVGWVWGAALTAGWLAWSGVGAVAGDVPLGWSNPVADVLDYLRVMEGQVGGSRLHALRWFLPFGAPQSSSLLVALPYRLVLFGAVGVAAWRGGVVGRFGAALAVLGALVPLSLAPGAERYFVLGFFGALLCLPIALAVTERRVAWCALSVLLLGGGIDNARWVQPGGIAVTRTLDPVALHHELGVWWLDIDELPAWNRLLREGRGNRFVGAVTRDTMGADCPAEPFGFPADQPIPRWDRQTCRGWREGELAGLPAAAVGEGLAEGLTEAQVLDALGRGAFVRGQRDLEGVRHAFVGLDAARSALVMAGAEDEARRQGPAR